MGKKLLKAGSAIVAIAGIIYFIKHNDEANKKVNDWVDAALDRISNHWDWIDNADIEKDCNSKNDKDNDIYEEEIWDW